MRYSKSSLATTVFKKMVHIYSLQNACSLRKHSVNITSTVQDGTWKSFCTQLKFCHSVAEIVGGWKVWKLRIGDIMPQIPFDAWNPCTFTSSCETQWQEAEEHEVETWGVQKMMKTMIMKPSIFFREVHPWSSHAFYWSWNCWTPCDRFSVAPSAYYSGA